MINSLCEHEGWPLATAPASVSELTSARGAGESSPMGVSAGRQLDITNRTQGARHFEAGLRRKIVGQHEAVQAVVNLYPLFRARLNSPGRPGGERAHSMQKAIESNLRGLLNWRHRDPARHSVPPLHARGTLTKHISVGGGIWCTVFISRRRRR
jgi:hypothetical protein